MYLKSFATFWTAARSLLMNRRALLLILLTYAALLVAIWLFITTREATIAQLIMTFAVIVAAPALFFLLQALSVNYTSGATARRLATGTLKVIVVTLPVIAMTSVAVYGLSKFQSHPTIVTTVRYLLMAVVAPLLAIHFSVASSMGLRALLKRLPRVVTRTFAPQSLFIYALGFAIFAVAPYLLLRENITIERPWLEFSVLILRLGLSALLILLGWVTTVGAISLLDRTDQLAVAKE